MLKIAQATRIDARLALTTSLAISRRRDGLRAFLPSTPMQSRP